LLLLCWMVRPWVLELQESPFACLTEAASTSTTRQYKLVKKHFTACLDIMHGMQSHCKF
jgi:hypothetical protein